MYFKRLKKFDTQFFKQKKNKNKNLMNIMKTVCNTFIL